MYNETTPMMGGYPILDLFLSMLLIFAWFVYVWVAISIVMDIFRRTDLSGWGKAGWMLVVVVFSWLGVLIYLIVNHEGMAKRREEQVTQAKGDFDDYVRQVTTASGPAGEIEKAKRLLDSGVIDQAEFNLLKSKALGSSPS